MPSNDLTLEKMKIDERLRSIELQITRYITFVESEKENLTIILNSMNRIIDQHAIDFKEHVKEDKSNFEKLGEKLWVHARYIYIAIGGVAVINIVINMHK